PSAEEITTSGSLISAQERAIAGNVGSEHRCQFAGNLWSSRNIRHPGNRSNETEISTTALPQTSASSPCGSLTDRTQRAPERNKWHKAGVFGGAENMSVVVRSADTVGANNIDDKEETVKLSRRRATVAGLATLVGISFLRTSYARTAKPSR